MSEVKDYLTFTKGIVTEASPLAFTENASVDEANCVLYRDGSRQRRLGLGLEDDAIWNSATFSGGFRWNVMEWEGVGNDANLRFVVVQAGDKLYFFDGSGLSFSSNLLYIYTFPTPSPIAAGLRVEGESVMGDFVVTSAGLPIVFKYNASTGVFTANYIQLVIRDIFGVYDGLAIDENPTTLSNPHKYNLLNQGWSKRATGTTPANATSIYPGVTGIIYGVIQQQLQADNITAYFTAKARYPDNTQVWWAGKNADDDFAPTKLDKIDFGTTPASKGRVLLDAFNRGASRNAVLTGASLPTDSELGRPTTLCFAFQRVWYAGIKSQVVGSDANSPVMTGFVFYSRTLRNYFDLGVCYTEGDPCSEYDSEIVDTDGGFINIPNSGQIYKVVNVSNAVVVLAQFGVWYIVGGQDGFTASNYEVKKITDFGVSSPEACVVADNGVFYWNEGGIFMVSGGDSGWSATNITEDSIETLLDGISEESKKYVTGMYDPVGKRISWLYRTNVLDNGLLESYDNELVLDIPLNAFYRNTYAENSPTVFVAGYARSKKFLELPQFHVGRTGAIQKYLVVTTTGDGTFNFTFGYQREATFRDFPTLGNYDYSSFLITGYEVAGLPSNKKWSPYIVCHFRQSETATLEDGSFNYPSSCLVQSRWDWSGSPASGKWGVPQQGYRLLRYSGIGAGATFDYGQSVVTTKLRLGGSGRALSLKFESESGKDFHIYGWSINASANPVI